ncbi:MAG: glycosyltransferase family 4 protein [Hyphomicrobium sp.]
MRIVFLSQYFDRVLPPEQNSVGIVSFEIARRLAADAEVTILTVGGRRGSRRTVVDGMTVEQLACAPPRAWSLAADAWSRVRPRARPLYAHSVYAFDYLLHALHRIRRLAPDVIHVQNFPQHVPLIRRAAPQAAIVLHMHCSWLQELDEKAMARAVNDSDMIVGCSEHVVHGAREKFRALGRRFAVLPNGAPVDVTPPQIREPRQPKVLFVGRLSPEKGVHTLLEAWPKVVAAYPQARLELIGSEGALPQNMLIDLSDEPDVRDLARFYAADASYGAHLRAMIPAALAHTVSFRGAVPYAQVKRAMSEAAVLVNPSFSESFGMSLIEAMGAETPVVATDVGGMPDIIKTTGGGELVPRNDPDALADAMLRRLADPEGGAQMARRARQAVVENYAWSRIASLARGYHMDAVEARRRRSEGGLENRLLKNV